MDKGNQWSDWGPIKMLFFTQTFFADIQGVPKISLAANWQWKATYSETRFRKTAIQKMRFLGTLCKFSLKVKDSVICFLFCDLLSCEFAVN